MVHQVFMIKLLINGKPLSSGSNGQSFDTPHPSISSQLVQPSHFSNQHLPEHPLTKVALIGIHPPLNNYIKM